MNEQNQCNQQFENDKSIFRYMMDSNMYINKNECFEHQLFMGYTHMNSPVQNIDIENNLRGIIRKNSRCTQCKYTPN